MPSKPEKKPTIEPESNRKTLNTTCTSFLRDYAFFVFYPAVSNSTDVTWDKSEGLNFAAPPAQIESPVSLISIFASLYR